jgi:hypothetical protein
MKACTAGPEKPVPFLLANGKDTAFRDPFPEVRTYNFYPDTNSGNKS